MPTYDVYLKARGEALYTIEAHSESAALDLARHWAGDDVDVGWECTDIFQTSTDTETDEVPS